LRAALSRGFWIALITVGFMSFVGLLSALAIDPPHNASFGVRCNSCHTIHNAPGGSLTRDASNANLCLSCHTSGGLANAVPFTDSMQASPGVGGTSHAWNATMPTLSDPSNAYGLRNTNDLSNVALKAKLQNYNNVITCSVCHNQHSQRKEPWDPYSSSTYTAGETKDRHFQRIDDQYNQMCEDCHYYRAMSYSQASDPSLANGTTIFSHPIGEIFNAQGYDSTAPLDANGVAQTDPQGNNRYAGDVDGNPANNMVLDNSADGTSNPGKVRCLSCHRIHYVDSNSLTNSTDIK